MGIGVYPYPSSFPDLLSTSPACNDYNHDYIRDELSADHLLDLSLTTSLNPQMTTCGPTPSTPPVSRVSHVYSRATTPHVVPDSSSADDHVCLPPEGGVGYAPTRRMTLRRRATSVPPTSTPPVLPQTATPSLSPSGEDQYVSLKHVGQLPLPRIMRRRSPTPLPSPPPSLDHVECSNLCNADDQDEEAFTEAYHACLGTVRPPSAPSKFLSWSLDGLRDRMQDPLAMARFAQFAKDQGADLLCFQGVQLRCHPEHGRSQPSESDATILQQFCSLFPEHTFHASLATTAMAGQLVGVRKSCGVPVVSFNLNVPTAENENTHDRHGRVMVLEFPCLLVVCRSAANTGPNQSEKALRRRADDKLVNEYLTNQSRVSSKPMLYIGDLDVCHHVSDMSATPDFWLSAESTGVRTRDLPADTDDRGYSPTTANNRKRFASLLSEASLIDPGKGGLDSVSKHTYRGSGALTGESLRVSYTCISKSLMEADCVREYYTPGIDSHLVKESGSRHSPVVLTLINEWDNRLKGVKGKVLKELTPHYQRKAASRRERTKPCRDRRSEMRKSRACVMFNWLQTSMLMHMVDDHPLMPKGAQYFTTHREGEILLSDSQTLRFNSLWDTGASNSNYMSSEFYELNREALEPYSHEVDTAVVLGDRRTRIRLNTCVTLPIRFTDDSGVCHESEISLMVLNSDGRDVIIGMPSLITDYGQMFKSMITKAVDRYSPPLSTGFTLSEVLPAERPSPAEVSPPEGCNYPWSVNTAEECPEDAMIPEAISNPRHLEFLTNGYDAEIEKFESLLESHIDANFLKEKPEILVLLRKYRSSFVKKEWVGLSLPEIIVTFKDSLPERLKPYTPRIPEHLKKHSEKEFKRMLEYFYIPCDSPWASPLTVAPKATEPFIRLCVNLRKINSYVEFGHFPIPNVKGTLHSLLPYKYFMDIDLKSSFHQMKLSEDASMKLSVQTPWGQYRPLFVPEGLCQASQNLQECMSQMFGGLGDWCHILFDNILIGADTHADMLEKLEKFLAKAEQYNVYLKLEKSWFGFEEVKFFGYKVTAGRYYLEDSRSDAIDLIPFPSGTPAAATTAMRSFLGQTRIFQPHVPDYTTYSAPLEKMTSVNFSWDKSTWTEDFEAIFRRFKARLKTAMELFMPDFEKEWIMRTDASNTGYGGVLYQVSVSADGKRVYEPIVFISRKFSDPATRWDTFSQECFAIFACVKECAHLLCGKPFIIETDHANLKWMESSEVPKIIRQHLYLRTFTCWVRHVPGKSNTADYWSRLLTECTLDSLYCGNECDDTHENVFEHICRGDDFELDFWNDQSWLDRTLAVVSSRLAKAEQDDTVEEPGRTAQELFDTVHGGKMLHQGVRRSWLLLNKLYPAHQIPISRVQDMVDECAVCQKFRLGLRDQLTPLARVLKPNHHRKTVGIDTLTITPESEDGYKAIVTIVNHYTHNVFLYPVKAYDSEGIANALMAFISNYGLFDELASDPGSDLMSGAVKEVNEWLGLRHVVSLVDVHTSNGCENTNKQIIQHLSSLCNDLRIKDKWSDPKILALIQLHFNGSVSSEAGIEPFKALFGSDDDTYYRLNPKLKPQEYQTAYVKRLDDALVQLRQISADFQQQIVAKRVDSTQKHNQFVVGDLVLKTVRTPTKHWKPEKLGPNFYGPYEITHVHANDYTCRHITDGTVDSFHVTMLKPYFGTRAMAKRAALLDHDQYVVSKVTQYIGDPVVRTSMEFFVVYADGDESWQVYSPDLAGADAFKDFCLERPELWPLVHTAQVARTLRVALNKEPITELSPGDVCYVDLRSINQHWYNGLETHHPHLPDEHSMIYVAPFTAVAWSNPRVKTKLKMHCPLLEHAEDWNHDMVKSWGAYPIVQDTFVLVDDAFLRAHPSVLSSLRARKVPQKLSRAAGRPKRL